MATGAEQLDDVRAQFDAVSAAAQRILTGNPAEKLQWRPRPGAWSAAECIAHLTLTNQHYYPLLNEAVPKLKPGDGPYGVNLAAKLLRWILEPPYRSGVKTLPSMDPEPASPHAPEKVLADFLDCQRQVMGFMAAGRGKAMDEVFIVSPFSKRVKYNYYACFVVLASHERRHIWQAEQTLKRSAEAPKAAG
jgi:hypothetical protein